MFSLARAEPRKQFAFTYFSMLCTAVPCSGPISLPANSTFANGSKPVTLQFGMKFFVTCEKGFVKDGGGGGGEMRSGWSVEMDAWEAYLQGNSQH